MGFRMRKSIKVAPGVRVNVSKRGVGASVGGKGGRYSVHSSGRRTVSAGSGVIPGVYYQKRLKLQIYSIFTEDRTIRTPTADPLSCKHLKGGHRYAQASLAVPRRELARRGKHCR
jgi:hypothetical protein